MKKITLTAAVIALTMSAEAVASPFGPVASSDDASASSSSSKEPGILASLLNAGVVLLGLSTTTADSGDEDLALQFYRKSEECPGDNEDAEASPAKEDKQDDAAAGPEPIYFGF